VLLKKYLQSAKFVKDATSPEKIKQFNDLIGLFRKYGNQYSMDYLLMMAQGFQESQLDQSVKSRVGAVGVMQVMPATGKEMKVGDITKIDPNINAGVKYMRFMIDQYYKDEPMTTLNKGPAKSKNCLCAPELLLGSGTPRSPAALRSHTGVRCEQASTTMIPSDHMSAAAVIAPAPTSGAS